MYLTLKYQDGGYSLSLFNFLAIKLFIYLLHIPITDPSLFHIIRICLSQSNPSITFSLSPQRREHTNAHMDIIPQWHSQSQPD